MIRSFELEILDDPNCPQQVRCEAHRDLTRIHCWLGNRRAILKAIRDNPFPVRRVIDIGCGNGDILCHIRKRLGCEVIGVDKRPCEPSQIPILRRDGVRETLPAADIAISLLVAHHLSEQELIALIRNVGRSSRRFILLDLVRHRLPLALFQVFVTPFVSHTVAIDGRTSIRRAYTPEELERIVRAALRGFRASFRHTVDLLRRRQIMDIRYGA